MAQNDFEAMARARIAETFGAEHVEGTPADDLVVAFAHSLARGSLIIQDSQSRIIYFRQERRTNQPSTAFSPS